ncbi:hypothetical protein ACVWW4_006676 [Bradyrhizobium sp. LB7.1]
MLNDTQTDKIRSLNDNFRRNLVIVGTVLLTPGRDLPRTGSSGRVARSGAQVRQLYAG